MGFRRLYSSSFLGALRRSASVLRCRGHVELGVPVSSFASPTAARHLCNVLSYVLGGLAFGVYRSRNLAWEPVRCAVPAIANCFLLLASH